MHYVDDYSGGSGQYGSKSAVEIANLAKTKAYNDHYDVLIIDTAGRLQIDEALMNELNDIKSSVNPEEILLLVDAMSGQDAVNVANSFNERLALTGAILSKLDGDERAKAEKDAEELIPLLVRITPVRSPAAAAAQCRAVPLSGRENEMLSIIFPDPFCRMSCF